MIEETERGIPPFYLTGGKPEVEEHILLGEAEEEPLPVSPYFGYQFFQGVPDEFDISAVGPVNDEYLVGFGDELRLTVWGAAEFQYDLQVDREGRIYLPNVGQFTAAGKRLQRLRRDLKKWLGRTYSGLATTPPTIFMDLTLIRLRPIKVFVLGEVARPGGYTVPNSSTVFSALYRVGGPLTRGSLRQIQVIRNGKLKATVDFYNYLLKGYDSNQIRLTENDHIFIPLRGKTVKIAGEVKRPAIYEVKENETLADLLEYAGGLTPQAYTKRLQIERIIPFGDRKDPSIARELIDMELEPILTGRRTVQLRDGDSVYVFSILDVVNNAVTVSGAVVQPGTYELGASIRTLSDLIVAADSLAGEAYLAKGDLVRTLDDSTKVLISIDITKVIRNDPQHNHILQARDHLIIYSLEELRIKQFVTVMGAVKEAGDYPLQQNMTVEDLIFKAGGFEEDVFFKSAQLSRLSSNNNPEGTKVEIIELSLVGAKSDNGVFAYGENDEARSLTLRHRDVLYVRSNPDFIPQQHVEITGEVLFPGAYALQKENESLADLIQRAGGILGTGFAQGGRLIRENQRVVVSFEAIMEGDTRADVILLDGDQIVIPRKPNTVAVRGNVGIEGLIKYRRGKKVAYYLDQAGGAQENTLDILLTQANGATYKLGRKLLIFRQNPVVDEGGTILVTSEEDIRPEDRTDTRQIISESLAMVTSVLTVLLLTQRVR
ncbi:MAG: SLBB domain-containing protein [Candidatus Marinimicrobia bacterium]|nr:SLBB domain-containing protein [Candidatus Neomarinimicrobiota bacterium]